jgi:hypothetical protein
MFGIFDRAFGAGGPRKNPREKAVQQQLTHGIRAEVGAATYDAIVSSAMKPAGTTRAAELASCIRENSDARAGAPAYITAYRVRPGTEAAIEMGGFWRHSAK